MRAAECAAASLWIVGWPLPASRAFRAARGASAGAARFRAARRRAWCAGRRIRAPAHVDDGIAQTAMDGVAVHARMP
jgi:hypothetical protein